MNNHKNTLNEIYLDYFNNYLTIDKFAEHNGITIDMARELIAIGRYIHEGNHIDK